jgi:hypothetical protein
MKARQSQTNHAVKHLGEDSSLGDQIRVRLVWQGECELNPWTTYPGAGYAFVAHDFGTILILVNT